MSQHEFQMKLLTFSLRLARILATGPKWAAPKVKRHPLCERCMDRAAVMADVKLLPVCGQAATETHYVVPLRDCGARFDEANCQALCHGCHAALKGVGGWV